MFLLLYNAVSQTTKILGEIIKRHYAGPCGPMDPVVPLVEMKRFLLECFAKLELDDRKSCIMSNSLLLADLRGVPSEGVGRLAIYVNDIKNGICNPKVEPKVVEEFSAVALVNGNNGLGPVTAKFCMDLAMEKALLSGVGLVAAKGSNHFGMAALYTLQAVDKGYIGLSFTNSYPVMVPPCGIKPALGANPISLAAPAHCEDLVVDIATTATTIPKIQMLAKRQQELPRGWALNDRGETERDPKAALKYNRLCPLGVDQGYKGFGLGLLVEALTGILADANYGTKIPNYKQQMEPPNIGHSFMAINPEKFVSNYATRLSKFLKQVRCMDAIDGQTTVIPGDKERDHMKQLEFDGGVRYTKLQLLYLEELARKIGVNPIDTSSITTCAAK